MLTMEAVLITEDTGVLSQTQNIVTKINILLQEICDMKEQNKKNNIFSDHKTHPKGTDEENVQGDTHSIYNSASNHLPLDKQNTPGHHAPNPNHTPSIGDNAFALQKPNPYELWSASPPESLSSSSSDKDSTDDNADCGGWVLMKTSLPLKRVGRGEGEMEMEGEREMRGGTEEACPGSSSDTVTKTSGPESDPDAGHC